MVLTSAWPKKVFHQLYQDDILIFVYDGKILVDFPAIP